MDHEGYDYTSQTFYTWFAIRRPHHTFFEETYALNLPSTHDHLSL